ncbi:hypothetical protein BGZ94_003628, partial [Podila epigama]
MSQDNSKYGYTTPGHSNAYLHPGNNTNTQNNLRNPLIPNRSNTSSKSGQSGASSDGSLQMLPIHQSPTNARYGGKSGGNGHHGGEAMIPHSTPHNPGTTPIRSAVSNNSLRPLPNPNEEAQLIRQRSQAQVYTPSPPNGGAPMPMPTNNVSFSMPMAMPTPIPSSIPEGHYPFNNGFGPQAAPYPYYNGGRPPMMHANSGTMHFGPAPMRQARRYKTTRKVQLTQGNLVLDCPIPSKLMDVLPKKNGDEFTTMRYTAVTCDPNDFAAQNYTLRPKMLNRETELFIVMTMYN